MSSGNPDRARRDRKVVDYTSQGMDMALHDALVAAHGDHSSLDLLGSADAEDPRMDTFRPREGLDSDESDDYDSDDSDEYEEDEAGRTLSRKKKEKTDAEKAAEMQVAEGLNVDYPAGLARLRKGLAYAYTAASGGSQEMGTRYALKRVIVDDRLTEADFERVIVMCQAVAATVREPKQALANIFEPLSNFNGGYFTKTARHMPLLSSIALGVEMANKMAEYRANGSVQAQGFAELLGSAGLGGDAVSMLTATYATETAEDSARVAGEKLAEQINALDDDALVQVLYYNIASFPQRAKLFQPSGFTLKREFDYKHYDHIKIKSAQETAEQKGVWTVSASLLLRSMVHNGAPQGTDRFTMQLKKQYGETALPENTSYKECRSFPRPKWTTKKSFTTNETYEESIKRLGYYVETHRAQKDFMLLSPSATHAETEEAVARGITKTFKEMLHPNDDTAPKLKDFLKTMGDLNDWGVNNYGAYVAVKFNGVAMKLGRKKQRSRTILERGQNYLHTGVLNNLYRHELQSWLKLDRDVDEDSFMEVMIPPWKRSNKGTVEFFVLLTDTPPEDVIALGTPRRNVYLDAQNAAGEEAVNSNETARAISEYKKQCYADMHKGENPDGVEKIRLKPFEKWTVDVIKEKAHAAAMASYRAKHAVPSFSMNYWHNPPTRSPCSGVDMEPAQITKKAKTNHEFVVAANPELGGSAIQNTTGFGRPDAYTAGSLGADA